MEAKESANDLKGELFDLERSINKVKKDLARADSVKATKDEMIALGRRLDAFSELEHMDYLQNKLIPKMEDFSLNLDDFLCSNEEMKECVRIFDKTISQKSSKAAVKMLKEESDAKFLKVAAWDSVREKFEGMRKKMHKDNADMFQRFEAFKV